MKPVIGLIPLWDEYKDSLWMLPGYMDGIREAGGLPLMFPLTNDQTEIEQLVDMVDGILFTGGHDVSPDVYGEDSSDLVVSCRARDDMELLVLKYALEKNKSILGICRGIQFINAALGGSLYQDLPSQHASATVHKQSLPYDVPIHKVILDEAAPLYDLLQVKELGVNSLHHQAVKKLAPGLAAMAISEDGLIEAVYQPDYNFLWAVQWHPEFAFHVDEASQKIFKVFIDSTKKD